MLHSFPAAHPTFCPYSECFFSRFRPGASSEPLSPSPASVPLGPPSGRFQRKGFYYRADDARFIARFKCMSCQRSFSSSRFTPQFGQKRRKINCLIGPLLCSGVSQRRAALLIHANRKTIVRKFHFLAFLAKHERLEYLAKLEEGSLKALQFDEMQSFERSKCLPVSIPLVVDPGTRRILSFRVASMPASGLLARISLKKYGPRKDERPFAVRRVWRELRPGGSPRAEGLTDRDPMYPSWIKRQLPHVKHETTPGRRGCVVGQGELKRGGHDPLFALNHTAAMIRANINRLVRRTWCTTKKRACLEAHLELYAQFHNSVLIGALA